MREAGFLQSRRWPPIRDQDQHDADQEQHHQADGDESEKAVFGAIFGGGKRDRIEEIATPWGRGGIGGCCLGGRCLVFSLLSIHAASIPMVGQS